MGGHIPESDFHSSVMDGHIPESGFHSELMGGQSGFHSDAKVSQHLMGGQIPVFMTVDKCASTDLFWYTASILRVIRSKLYGSCGYIHHCMLRSTFLPAMFLAHLL